MRRDEVAGSGCRDAAEHEGLVATGVAGHECSAAGAVASPGGLYVATPAPYPVGSLPAIVELVIVSAPPTVKIAPPGIGAVHHSQVLREPAGPGDAADGEFPVDVVLLTVVVELCPKIAPPSPAPPPSPSSLPWPPGAARARRTEDRATGAIAAAAAEAAATTGTAAVAAAVDDLHRRAATATAEAAETAIAVVPRATAATAAVAPVAAVAAREGEITATASTTARAVGVIAVTVREELIRDRVAHRAFAAAADTAEVPVGDGGCTDSSVPPPPPPESRKAAPDASSAQAPPPPPLDESRHPFPPMPPPPPPPTPRMSPRPPPTPPVASCPRTCSTARAANRRGRRSHRPRRDHRLRRLSAESASGGESFHVHLVEHQVAAEHRERTDVRPAVRWMRAPCPSICTAEVMIGVAAGPT